ncbi:MAG TPA: response regulator [Desulfobacterales bacterium]|nr:response regulator [Desulfobacterales bacterium]HIP39796.1 response regulator [Desulfocapsa sulfexigens]
MPPRKILVVNDESFISDMSRNALGDIGLEVYCVPKGEQAVEMAMDMHFDLAIVDYLLPGMTGVEAFDIMRQADPGIAGILVADNNNQNMLVEAMNIGFSGFLQKPIDSSALVDAVLKSLSAAGLRDENTRLKILLPLYKLGEKFIAAGSMGEVYELLLEAISLQIDAPSISMMMYDEDEKCLHVVASRGMDQNVVGEVSVKSGEKIAGWVFEHGEPIIFNRQTQAQSPLAQYLLRDEISASISFPLVGREKILGVLNISQTSKEVEYCQSDIEMLSAICGQAVMALENVAYMKERERHVRTKALFEQYVAPEVAEILLSSGKSLLEIGGVEEISILFADIRNFTVAVQHLSHYNIHCFLTQFFDLFSEVAFSWKGTLDKFMGDAALVAFGAPISIEAPSDSAVNTAVELSQKFEQLRFKWLEKHAVFEQLGLGIGVSRGEVFLGNVGSSRRLDYTVIGTEVNIVQRLASSARSGHILITESVYKDLNGRFPLKKEEARKLRGVEHDVKLYSIQADLVKLS